MSQEHHHEHTERHERQQAQRELEQASRERLNELTRNPEAADNSEERANEARKVIHRQERGHEPEPAPAAEAAPAEPKPSFIAHHLNYAQTMASMQRHLSPVSRGFSKVIHTPVVEKTSEVLEQTVARPSVAAGATWTALIVGGVFYLTARHYGYMLSGSEMLFSFVVGAVIGLVLEGLWRGLRPRR